MVLLRLRQPVDAEAERAPEVGLTNVENDDMKGTQMNTMPSVSKKAQKLLLEQLGAASGVETCQGRAKLWSELVKAGFVRRVPYSGFLGHPFCYELTDVGYQAVKSLQ